MERHENEFHTPYEFHIPSLSDDEEQFDYIHVDSNFEHFEVLDQNEEKVELPSKACEIPTLGMTFDNDDEAYHYYNSYARGVGFCLRKIRKNKDMQGVLWKIQICCSCKRFYKERKLR